VVESRRRLEDMNPRKFGALALGAVLVVAACNTGGGATATPGATEVPTQAPAEVRACQLITEAV
jgi:hypothetical protein